MKLRLDRFVHGTDSTLGCLFVDDVFQCFTCEDEFRTKKISGETRIPAGTYKIEGRSEGTLIQKYRKKFGEIQHPVMLWIKDVPDFTFVYIHIGNTDDDSDACILTGKGATLTSDGGTVQNSTAAYIELYRKVLTALGTGESVKIQIRDL